ncbi:PAS domain S-box protein, partial [bacterium]
PTMVGSYPYLQIERTMREREPIQFETLSPTLQTWVDAHVYPTADGGLCVYFQDITERKQTEERLKESEQRFRTLADSIPQLAWMTDATGWIFWYNKRWFDYTGTTLEDMEGWGWQKVHHPEHLERVTEKFRRALEDGQSWEDTFPLRGKDGEFRWFLSRAFPIRDEHGKVSRWFGTNTDITEQLQAEAALRKTNERLKESEELSRLALTVGQAGAWSWDLRTSTLRWSDEYYRIFGIEPGSIAPQVEAGLSRIHPEDQQHVAALIERTLTSGEGIDDIHRVIWPDGSQHWVRWMAKAFFVDSSESKPDRLVGLAIDVTAQKEAEERLYKLNQDLQRRNRELDAERLKWQRLIEGIADEVWACDANGKVSMVNLATGANKGLMDFEGKTLEETLREIEVLHPDGSVRPDEESPLRRSLQGDVLRGEEIVRNRRTGTTRIRQYSSAPVGDTEGRVIGAVAVIRDVTEERQAESEIRRLNEELEERVKRRTAALERANQELESFSYSVSHDLKAPLRVIEGFTRMLSDQYRVLPPEKQQQYIGLIQSGTQQMARLIESLLAFARVSRQVPQKIKVNMQTLAEEVVREQRQAIGEQAAQVMVIIGEMPREATGDPVLLRQVFANLLANAFKFTRRQETPIIEIGGYMKNGDLVYFVRDNGVGFPSRDVEKLFQVFQRLHAQEDFEGSGIGLANCRKFVERHGGEVLAEGEEGAGATFYFSLPGT